MSDGELTLDPSDWGLFRRPAHTMVDDMIDHLSSLSAQPAWRSMPDQVRARFTEPPPMNGEGEDSAYRCFVENVLPYPNGNLHPVNDDRARRCCFVNHRTRRADIARLVEAVVRFGREICTEMNEPADGRGP
jgi:hypothetical protein